MSPSAGAITSCARASFAKGRSGSHSLTRHACEGSDLGPQLQENEAGEETASAR